MSNRQTRTASSTSRSISSSQAAGAQRISDDEIAEMWARAKGTWTYPEFNARGEILDENSAETINAGNLARHQSKTDRVALDRIQYMKALAREDEERLAQAQEDQEKEVREAKDTGVVRGALRRRAQGAKRRGAANILPS